MSKSRGMHRWDPLTDRQVLLLRRIQEGDDLSGPDGAGQRSSARSLQNRGLVDVSRRDGAWRAAVTEIGSYYLEHGHHPEHPDHQPVAESGAATPTPAQTPAPPSPAARRLPAGEDRPRQLIKRLQDEGGTITIDEPDDDTRAHYRRLIDAAKRHKLVPEGFHLLHAGRDHGDLVIRLSDDSAPDDTDWNRVRLTSRRVKTDPAVL